MDDGNVMSQHHAAGEELPPLPELGADPDERGRAVMARIPGGRDVDRRRSDHELMHPLTAAAADQVERRLLDAGVFDGMAGHLAHACSERCWPALSADAGRLLRVDSTLDVDHI